MKIYVYRNNNPFSNIRYNRNENEKRKPICIIIQDDDNKVFKNGKIENFQKLRRDFNRIIINNLSFNSLLLYVNTTQSTHFQFPAPNSI